MSARTDEEVEKPALPGGLGIEIAALFGDIDLTMEILQLRGFVLAPVDFGG